MLRGAMDTVFFSKLVRVFAVGLEIKLTNPSWWTFTFNVR